MLWGNVGFRALRKVKLDDYESRYDPTVIPIDAESNPDAVGAEEVLNRSYRVGSKSVNRHHSVADYHSAYEGGKLTPTIVAETLLDLISNSSKHKEAFLEIRRDRVIAAAEASTQRYKDGKARGLFDGVPVAVKGIYPFQTCSLLPRLSGP